MTHPHRRILPLAVTPAAVGMAAWLAAGPLLLAIPQSGHAQSAAAPAAAASAPASPLSDIEQMRSTTSKLINLLIEQGVLTRTRAEALLKEVEAPTKPVTPQSPSWGTPAVGAASSATGTVRVPYIPAFVRNDLKEELRNEIAAQGIREGWAGPGVVPAWVRGLRIDGDVRFRAQADRYPDGNVTAVNIGATNSNRATTFLNITEDRQRLRVRARLGLTATVDDNWSAAMRLTTGSLTDPNSSNQTLGNYNNRFQAAFDRANIRYRYGDQFNAVFGRFGNPWFSTDMVWANDLSFDGITAQWTPQIGSLRGFLTGAIVPIQEVELSRRDKWLFGAQVGADFPGNTVVKGKLGLGFFAYVNMVGKPNDPGLSLNDFTAAQTSQKGNTYFNISTDINRPLLALASDYRILNLTGALDIESIAGKHVILTADLAKNLAFDSSKVAARLGQPVDARTLAGLIRVAFGHPDVHARNEWQVFFSYKRVEADSVLDAFTDTDLRLGGTNVKGFVLGGSYALGRNTAFSARWLSGDAVSGPPLSIDSLQLDLSVRF